MQTITTTYSIVEQIDKEIYELMKNEDIKQKSDNEKHNKRKCQIIQDYAKRLEEEGKLPIDTICKYVTDKLHEFVSERWVQTCLDGKYKNIEQTRRSQSGRINTSQTKTNPKMVTDNKVSLSQFVKELNVISLDDLTFDIVQAKIETVEKLQPKFDKTADELIKTKLEAILDAKNKKKTEVNTTAATIEEIDVYVNLEQAKKAAKYYRMRYHDSEREVARRGNEIVQLKRNVQELEQKIEELEAKVKG